MNGALEERSIANLDRSIRKSFFKTVSFGKGAQRSGSTSDLLLIVLRNVRSSEKRTNKKARLNLLEWLGITNAITVKGYLSIMIIFTAQQARRSCNYIHESVLFMCLYRAAHQSPSLSDCYHVRSFIFTQLCFSRDVGRIIDPSSLCSLLKFDFSLLLKRFAVLQHFFNRLVGLPRRCRRKTVDFKMVGWYLTAYGFAEKRWLIEAFDARLSLTLCYSAWDQNWVRPWQRLSCNPILLFTFTNMLRTVISSLVNSRTAH